MKTIKIAKDRVDSLIEKMGVGIHVLKWSTGSDVVVHISKVVGRITIMENNDNRLDSNIMRKLNSK
jgi:hypothetical protein